MSPYAANLGEDQYWDTYGLYLLPHPTKLQLSSRVRKIVLIVVKILAEYSYLFFSSLRYSFNGKKMQFIDFKSPISLKQGY